MHLYMVQRSEMDCFNVYEEIRPTCLFFIITGVY